MLDQKGSYRVRCAAAAIVAAAPKAVIQWVAPAAHSAEVIHFSISQTSGAVTTGIEGIGLIVPSAATTMATAGVATAGSTNTVYDLAGAYTAPFATLSTSTVAIGPTTFAGTINAVAKKFNPHCLAGYEWNATPNDRVCVPPSGLILLYCYAILSATWDFEMTVREM